MQEKKSTRSNQSRREATRAALLGAARKLFAEKGYAETSTPEIVRAAEVTRGALYHHFEDKEALFHAVVTDEFQAVATEINAMSGQVPDTALEALNLGGRGFLQAMQDKGRVRIMLLDGPAVLGRQALDEIDRATSMDSLRLGLQAAMENGEIKQLPIEALTVQISAMFDRAALALHDGQSAEDHLAVLDAIIASLK